MGEGRIKEVPSKEEGGTFEDGPYGTMIELVYVFIVDLRKVRKSRREGVSGEERVKNRLAGRGTLKIVEKSPKQGSRRQSIDKGLSMTEGKVAV